MATMGTGKMFARWARKSEFTHIAAIQSVLLSFPTFQGKAGFRKTGKKDMETPKDSQIFHNAVGKEEGESFSKALNLEQKTQAEDSCITKGEIMPVHIL